MWQSELCSTTGGWVVMTHHVQQPDATLHWEQWHTSTVGVTLHSQFSLVRISPFDVNCPIQKSWTVVIDWRGLVVKRLEIFTEKTSWQQGHNRSLFMMNLHDGMGFCVVLTIRPRPPSSSCSHSCRCCCTLYYQKSPCFRQ